MMTVVAGLAVAMAFVVAEALYFGIVLRRETERTLGLGYYGLPAAGRAAYKRKLRRQALILSPFLRLLSLGSKLDLRQATFQFRGVAGPRGTGSPASSARAAAFVPGAGDVIVATQMKSGTTWMQHLVYQILRRGRGDLVETGTALYAVSPWLEGLRSVSVEAAPLIGTERPGRIIKTHLPASLCRWAPDAKYLCVVRHPVSTFASCVDFMAGNVGRLAPPMAAFEEWFRSRDLMWWGTWPDHVKGWWALSRAHPNVMVVTFEEMKRDLPGTAARVADFLGVAPLAPDEMTRVVERCGFEYMRTHREAFEMHPPQVLQVDAEMFVKGSIDRHRDVPADIRARLVRWVAAEMSGSDFPLGRLYPDLAEPAA